MYTATPSTINGGGLLRRVLLYRSYTTIVYSGYNGCSLPRVGYKNGVVVDRAGAKLGS